MPEYIIITETHWASHQSSYSWIFRANKGDEDIYDEDSTLYRSPQSYGSLERAVRGIARVESIELSPTVRLPITLINENGEKEEIVFEDYLR
jgi:hypothetical protein